MTFNYALEFQEEMDNNWVNPSGNNYDNNKENSKEDKIIFLLSLIDKLIECIRLEAIGDPLNLLIQTFIHGSWQKNILLLMY